jgi:hypothetical protein
MGEQPLPPPRQGRIRAPPAREYVLVEKTAVDTHYDGVPVARESVYKDRTAEQEALKALAKQKVIYRPELATEYGVAKYNATHKWKPENEKKSKLHLIEKDGVLYTYQDTNENEQFDDADNIIYVNGKRYAKADKNYDSTYIKVERAREPWDRVKTSEFRQAYYEEKPRKKKNGQPYKVRESGSNPLSVISKILSKNGSNLWDNCMQILAPRGRAGPEILKKYKSQASLMKTSALLLNALKSDHFQDKYESNANILPDKKTFNKELVEMAPNWVDQNKTLTAMMSLLGLDGAGE